MSANRFEASDYEKDSILSDKDKTRGARRKVWTVLKTHLESSLLCVRAIPVAAGAGHYPRVMSPDDVQTSLKISNNYHILLS